MKDTYHDNKAVQTIAPAVKAASENGAAIALAGFDSALIVINTTARHPSAPLGGQKTLKTTAKAGSTFVDVLDPAGATVPVKSDGTVDVTVPPQSAMILIPQDKVGP